MCLRPKGYDDNADDDDDTYDQDDHDGHCNDDDGDDDEQLTTSTIMRTLPFNQQNPGLPGPFQIDNTGSVDKISQRLPPPFASRLFTVRCGDGNFHHYHHTLLQ